MFSGTTLKRKHTGSNPVLTTNKKMNNYDILGYIGTALILISFLIDNVFKLRLVNTIGAVFWFSYGIFAHANPTIVANFSVILVHSYWFIKNRKDWNLKKK